MLPFHLYAFPHLFDFLLPPSGGVPVSPGGAVAQVRAGDHLQGRGQVISIEIQANFGLWICFGFRLLFRGAERN